MGEKNCTADGRIGAAPAISDALGLSVEAFARASSQTDGFSDAAPATRLRMLRAAMLRNALADAHGDDADQIIAAWLYERSGDGPRTAFMDMSLTQIKGDAEMWAEVSPRLEIAAYVRAGLQKLAASALAPAMRKALIAALWKGLSADDKRSFIARVSGQ